MLYGGTVGSVPRGTRSNEVCSIAGSLTTADFHLGVQHNGKARHVTTPTLSLNTIVFVISSRRAKNKKEQLKAYS